MLTKANVMKIFFCVLALTLFAFSKLSYADWSIGVGVGREEHHDGWRERHDEWRDHHDDWRERERERRFFYYHDHPNYGYHLQFLPAGYDVIWVDGTMYYYYDGLYYIREGFDYVLVSPPVGAYVNVIPPDFQAVSINGRIYYTNNGFYYLLTENHSYEVVPQPVVYAQPQQVIVTTQVPAPVASQDSFPVNIPNSNGSYTTVVIKKSGNGYVGPQGEFYSKFPTVAQLKTMYVK